jgi:hypothetical protein
MREMNTMRKRMIIAVAVFCGIAAWPASGQVNYHRAQQAGKVWERKQNEANRKQRAKARGARQQQKRGPLSAKERAAALAANRADYNRLVRSVGKKNADRWLEFKARAPRPASSAKAVRKRR